MDKISSDTKRPRGRPALLDRSLGARIAEGLFHRDGYDHVGVVALCDALGVRQPALYRVFGSKTGLFDAALERYAEGPFASFVAEEAARSRTPTELTHHVLQRAATIYAQDPDRRGCLALETAYASGDEAARETAKRLVDRTRLFLADRFAALGATDADAHAHAVLIAMRGLSSAARDGQSETDLQKAVDALIGR